MLYTRFTPIARNQWEVTAPVKSKKPIAKVTPRSVTVNRAISREELDSLSAFMQEREH